MNMHVLLDYNIDQSQFLGSENWHLKSEVQKFTCIRTVTFLDTWSNDTIEDLCSIREIFDRYGIWKKVEIISLLYLKNRYSLKNCAEDLLESLQCYWVSSDFLEEDILYDRQQVRLDKIWPEFIEDMYDGRFYFYISWFKPCICHGTW